MSNASIKRGAAMKTTMTRLLSLLALATSMPAVAVAQERVGVATTVVGPVTVTHVATSPAPLKFKDDVLLNDRVATGDNAFARMLLGGKAIVTARERSIVTITEAPGVSTIDLASGRISVAVDKSRMRPGEVVEIKTPNAVSGIRGTIVVAEVAGDVSTITVLRGLVDVYRRDPASGQAVGSATPVGVRESVTVKANVLPARPQPISVDHARKLAKEFTTPVQPVSPATTITADEVSRAKALIGALTDGQSVTAIPTQIDPLAARTETPTTSGMLPPPTALAPNSPLPTAPIVGAVPTAPLPTAPIVSPLPTTPLPTAPIVSPLPTAPLPTSPIAAPLPTVPKITPTVPTLTVPLPTNSLLK
jgi:hypothetical protein